MIACGWCGAGRGHWPWCSRSSMAPGAQRGVRRMAVPCGQEPRNVHASWCNIWTTERKPCNCGAG